MATTPRISETANLGWSAARGFFNLLVGVLFLLMPLAALSTAVFLFSFYFILGGILAASYACRGGSEWSRGTLIIESVLSFLTGFLALLWPGITLLSLAYLVAFWACFVGVVQIAAAFRWPDERGHRLWISINGTLSLALGLAFAFFPFAGLQVLVLLMSVYAILHGITSLACVVHQHRIKNGKPGGRTELSHA